MIRRIAYEDLDNPRRNMVTIWDGAIAYNAVLSATFSGEAAYTTQLTLQEVKDYCSIDGTDLDTLLANLIPAARIKCEKKLNKSFVQRTVTAKVVNDLGNLELPYGPVIGDITSITDNEGTAVVVADYDFESPANTGELTFVYTAGYAAGELPEDYKVEWLEEIHYLLDNRGKRRA